MFWFFLAQSLVFSLCYFASAVGVYFFPGPTRRFMVPLASCPYLVGWCCLIGAIYLHSLVLPLVIAGGAMLGLGSAGFYMLWQRLFSSTDPDRGSHDLILGTAYGAILYFALYAIPQAVTAYLIPFVFMPLFGLAIVLKSREINLGQPMFEDIPREHPRVYRRVLHDYWRSALCIGAVAFCAGVMRSLAIGDPEIGSLVNVLSMAASFAAAAAVLVLWQMKNVRLNVLGAYRVAFPFLITSFLALPLIAGAALAYARWQAAILYAVYSIAIMLMMTQCAQASRDRGINPVFIYGFMGGIVYALHDVGFLAGTFAEQIRVIGVDPVAVTALVAVYLLGLMFFVGHGGFKISFGTGAAPESIELTDVAEAGAAELGVDVEISKALSPAAATAKAPNGTASSRSRTAQSPNPTARQAVTAAPAPAPEPAQPKPAPSLVPPAPSPAQPGRLKRAAAARENHAPVYQDRLSKQAQLVRQHYRLSARETEVMELIARGNTVARIADELFVSENTIRTHSKRIYTKLDIHRKQELLDLVDSFDPRDLKE